LIQCPSDILSLRQHKDILFVDPHIVAFWYSSSKKIETIISHLRRLLCRYIVIFLVARTELNGLLN
jgi:hypothetical protein